MAYNRRPRLLCHFSRCLRCSACSLGDWIIARIMSALALAASPFLCLRRRFPLAVYVANRVLLTALMMFLFGFVFFGAMSLSEHDIVDIMLAEADRLGEHYTLSPEQLAYLRVHLGVDRPWHAQYFRWLGRVLRGDFGVTLAGRDCVRALVMPRLRNTILLMSISLAVSMSAAVALGVFFSTRAGSKADLAVTSFAVFLHSLPPLAVLLGLQLFAFRTWLFPVSGVPVPTMAPNLAAFVLMYLHHIFLLVLANFVFTFGYSQRMAKMFMLDQVGQPYIIALRSRGFSERRILFRHALRNALGPLANLGVMQAVVLLNGTLMLEVIFSFPGIGTAIGRATFHWDGNLIMVIVFIIGSMIALCVLVADIALALIDPRIRYGKG